MASSKLQQALSTLGVHSATRLRRTPQHAAVEMGNKSGCAANMSMCNYCLAALSVAEKTSQSVRLGDMSQFEVVQSCPHASKR